MKCLPCLGGVLAGLAVATSVWAAPQVATLEDGRQVILHDDFTWQYVVPVEQRKHQPAVPSLESPATPVATLAKPSAVATAPVAATQVLTTPKASTQAKVRGVYFVPGEHKDIQQLNRMGVDVVLHSADYHNGRLEIPTSLTNQSTKSVVLVEMSVIIRNEQGRELARLKDKIWTSVKRMPETYFRPDTHQQGRALKVSVPEAKGYFIEAEIIEVEFW